MFIGVDGDLHAVAQTESGTSTAWTISQWSTKGSRFAFAGNPPESLVNQFCSSVPADKIGPLGFAPCLAQHGYTQLTSYQPASRFWPFQWIEGGWLLALSALLIVATIWLVHRRAALCVAPCGRAATGSSDSQGDRA